MNIFFRKFLLFVWSSIKMLSFVACLVSCTIKPLNSHCWASKNCWENNFSSFSKSETKSIIYSFIFDRLKYQIKVQLDLKDIRLVLSNVIVSPFNGKSDSLPKYWNRRPQLMRSRQNLVEGRYLQLVTNDRVRRDKVAVGDCDDVSKNRTNFSFQGIIS